MITIYSADGEIRFETEINTGSKRDRNLNGEDYAMLKFSVARPVPFAVGDYANIPGEGRMVVVSVPQPTYDKTTGGFDYELRLEPEWALFGNKLLKLNPAANAEVEFKLTDTLANHMRMALKCISACNLQWHDADGAAHDYTFEISDDTDIVPDDARFISYSSTDILSGLREMASVFGCECWIEDGVIHFGKNEHGDIVQFERDDNVIDITPSGRDGARPNRLYAFGGTENIPPYYRKEMIFRVTDKEVKSDGRIFASDQDHPLKLDMFPASMQVADPNRTISFNELKETLTIPAADLPYNQSYTLIYNSATIKGLGHGSYTVRLSEWNPVVNLPHTAFQFSGDLTFYYTDTNGEENYRKLMLPPKTFDSTEPQQFGWDDFILSLPKDSDVRIAICIYCKKTDRNIVLGDVIMQYGLFPMYLDNMTTYVSVEGITVTKADGTEISGAAINSGHNPFTGIIPLELPAGSEIEVGDAFRLPDILRSRIPASWFTAENVEDVIDAVASNRLRLPSDTPYIDANDSVTDATAIEHVEIFDDVYPKQDNTIDEVWSYEASTTNNDGSTTTGWYYCINDSKLKFSADCMIPGVDLRVKFTSGLLNGMTFQVEWLQYGKYETDNKPAFEIAVNEDFGRRLPNTVLRPKKGDKFILLGWADDTLYDLLIQGAELQLRGKAREWMEASHADGETYDCPMIPEKAKEWMPTLGQRVRLNDAALFPSGSFVSRVIGLQYPLDIPFDSPTVIVGNKIPRKRLEGVEEQIKALGKIDDYTIPEVATNIGASTIECALTNQSDTIVFDDFGTIIGGLPSTSVRVWANGVRYNNFALSLDGDYYGLGLSIDGDTLRVTSADLNIEDNTSVGINVAINAGGAVIERKLIFTLLKRRGDMRYQLQPSHTSIRVAKSKALYPTPENLSCGILAVGNGSSEIISADDGYDIGLKIGWRMITGTDQSDWLRDVPQYDASTTMLQCRLMQDDECIDIQSIPLIEDGTDGIDGKDGKDGHGSVNSYVFCLSEKQPATPTGGSYTDLVPEGWSDGFPADPEDDNFGLSVWMSRRLFTTDGLPPQDPEWTEPTLFGNNSHQQMLYSTADEQPPSPSVDESAWDDEACRDTVWMATRHRVNALKNPGWSDWSIIRIKGETGKDGKSVSIDSQSVRYSTSHTIARPAESTFTLDDVPALSSGQYLWSRTTVTYSDGKSTNAYAVSRIGADGLPGSGVTISSSTITYAKTKTNVQPADADFIYSSITAAQVEKGDWLWSKQELRYSDGTITRGYTVSRIGSDGANGEGIPGTSNFIHYAYATSADGVTGFSTVAYDAAVYIGVCVTDTEPDPTDPAAYEWSRFRGYTPILDPNTNKWTYHTDPSQLQLTATTQKFEAIENNASLAVSEAATAKQDASTAKTNATTALNTANAANTNAQAAADKADKAQTTADSAKTTADTAKTTADTAKSTADTAKTTADTAKSTADTAKSTADTASSNASWALSTATQSSKDAGTALNKATSVEKVANTANENATSALDKATAALNTAESKASLSDVKQLSLADFSNLKSEVASASSLSDLSATVNSNHSSLLSAVNEKVSLADVEDEGFVRIRNKSSKVLEYIMLYDTDDGLAISACGYQPGVSYEQCFPIGGGGSAGLTESQVNTLIKAYASPLGHTHSQYLTGVSWGIMTGKPTTISGYGITDAHISGNVITLGSNKIVALTSHQPIYALTFAAGAFAAKTFAASSAAATVNIPTKTSHLTNDSGFLTSHQSLANYVTLNTTQTISAVKTFASDIYFKGVEDSSSSLLYKPVTSYGLFWQGSSDTCRLYWNCPTGNDGTLHISHKDDGDESTTFEWNDVATYQFRKTSLSASSVTATFAVIKKASGTASQALMADGSVKTVHTLSSVTNLGWGGTSGQIATINTLAYWNGQYASGGSNLQYCDRGRFGTMATATASDYVAKTEVVNHAPALAIGKSTIIATIGGVGIAASLPETLATKAYAQDYCDSGLNALYDTLDDYLPLLGGIVTGNLVVSRSTDSTYAAPLQIASTATGIRSGIQLSISTSSFWNIATPNASTFEIYSSAWDLGSRVPALRLVGNTLMQFNGNTVWHAGNLTKLSQLSNDSGFISASASSMNSLLNSLAASPGSITQSTITPGQVRVLRLLRGVNGSPYNGYDTCVELGLQSYAAWRRPDALLRVSTNDSASTWATFTFGSNGSLTLPGRLYINQYIYDINTNDIYINSQDCRVTYDGDVYCWSLTETSDIRLKAITRHISPDIRAIASARAVDFNWLKNGKADCGCIAQDWCQILPATVKIDGRTGYMSMDYGKAALISAISIARSVVSHESRIATLERETAQLKADNLRLNNLLQAFINSQNSQKSIAV